MKRFLKYAAPALALALNISSCSDLATDPMDQNVTTGQKNEAKEMNPEMALAGVSGVAKTLNTYMTVLNRHNDFGYPALMLFSDCRGVDMVSPNSGYNWFAESAELSDCNVNSDYTELLWGVLYQQVFASNAVLDEIKADTTDPFLQFYRAQALAFRSFDFMMLAQNYQFPYAGHQDEPCIMLITEKNREEATVKGCLRSSVADTYSLIINDLTDAINLLTESGVRSSQVISSQPKRFISLATAYGLRARANLLMENWADAASDARAAITQAGREGISPLSMAEAAQPGFNNIESHSWMWGIPVAETDRVVTSSIINFPSHMGSMNYGYAGVGAFRSINQALFASIPATDVRRGWWLDADGISTNLSAEWQEYASGSGLPPFTQVKYAPYQNELGTSNNASDVPLMRIEEMYLIEAEATAMAGNPGTGAGLLSQFVSAYRDPSFSATSGSSEQVQDQVFTQRRIELWGEGLTYYDFLRLNKGLDRTGAGFPDEWDYNIPAGSDLLRLPIPQTEVQGNEAFRLANNNNKSASRPVAQ